MALGFFRKRQKLIFIIMVLLMVSFLIGFQGFSMLFQKNPNKVVLGTTPDGKVTLGEFRSARSDLELLRFLAPGFGQNTLQGAAFEAMMTGAPREDERALSFLLLLQQARENDFTVTDPEIDQMILRMTSNGLDFEGLATHLRQNRGLPRDRLREVLGLWLTIFKAYQANQIMIPPSREELERLYCDVSEKINLRVLRIPAEDFVEKIPDPTEKQIDTLFETYKNRPAGTFTGIEAFPFGYLHPARVQVGYLLVHSQAIERAAAPSDEAIAEYLRTHESEMVKTVEGKIVPMTPQEQHAEAMDKLRPDLAKAKFVDAFDRVASLLRRQTETSDAPAGDYAEIVNTLTLPGEELLQRKVLILAIDKQPLSTAVERLAQAASPRLSVICFPYGLTGKVHISPDVKITLHATNLTVGEALEKIAKQIPDLPKLSWGCFEGIDDVLFPVGGVRMFPVSAGRTSFVTPKQLSADPLLGKCFSQELRISLPQAAFQVRALVPKSEFRVGQEGPLMTAWNTDARGQLFWRVLEAQPARSPREITDALRTEIVRDGKLEQAFALASKEAEAIQTAKELDAYVRKHKLAPVETGMFARRTPYVYGRGYFQPTQLEKLSLQNPAVDRFVIDRAFEALAPKDLAADYSPTSSNLLVLPLPCEEAVLIAQRIDYAPAEAEQFEADKLGLVAYLEQQQFGRSLQEWFALVNIKKRTGYAPKTPK